MQNKLTFCDTDTESFEIGWLRVEQIKAGLCWGAYTCATFFLFCSVSNYAELRAELCHIYIHRIKMCLYMQIQADK